jgi:hypothetical protein
VATGNAIVRGMTTAGRDRCSPPRATPACIIEGLTIAGVSVVTVIGTGGI